MGVTFRNIESFASFGMSLLTRNYGRPKNNFGAKDIYERDFVTLFVRSNRIVQGYVFTCFLERTQVHQDFVFNTTGSKSSQFCAFIRAITLNRFDQPDRSDEDQILHVLPSVIEFLEVMDTM